MPGGCVHSKAQGRTARHTCVWLMIASAQLCSGGGWGRSRASLGDMSITLGGSWGSSSSACCQLTCHEIGFQQQTAEFRIANWYSGPGRCRSSHCSPTLAAGQGIIAVFLQAQLLPSRQQPTYCAGNKRGIGVVFLGRDLATSVSICRQQQAFRRTATAHVAI